ncbi:MAG: exodeoxyribonuclease V subunit alpha [Deltaproteobacteria bacterium]|nr:exodeoxyribonuclease V subunit alpha [Deltaproteobacteria bacterium]
MKLQEQSDSILARRFAELMVRGSSGDKSSILRSVVVRLISAVEEGHSCLDLSCLGGVQGLQDLNLTQIVSALLDSKVVGTAADSGPYPIIVDGSRLYLKRHFDDECLVARVLSGMVEPYKSAVLEDVLGVVVSGADASQRQAVEVALRGGFTVITGGPGTGKTSTVLRVIAARILLAQALGKPPPRVALAAPTGKAAARLAESVRSSCERGVVSKALATLILEGLDTRTFTLHRLLGYSKTRGIFLRGPENPLEFDLVILDEASMCSLTLMARLCAALLPGVDFVMLGDKDQLASVEAGAVLGEICQAGLEPASPLFGRIAELTENHRSANAEGLVSAASAIRRADARGLFEALGDALAWEEDLARFYACIDELAAEKFEAIAAAASVEEAFKLAERFRIIAATRVGTLGVDVINRRVKTRLGFSTHSHYRGEPVMATANDYDLKVFNGDVGMIWEESPGSDRLAAWFPADGGALKPFPIARFSGLVPFYAASVHKSQGSEFEEVFFVLPPKSAVATRELVYTAVTRARSRVRVWASREALKEALGKATSRHSGLGERLRRGRKEDVG